MLQEDLNKILEWSHRWEMEFNPEKCKVMEFGKSERNVKGIYVLNGERLSKAEEENNLGVTVNGNLIPEKHISRTTQETYNLLSL